MYIDCSTSYMALAAVGLVVGYYNKAREFADLPVPGSQSPDGADCSWQV